MSEEQKEEGLNVNLNLSSEQIQTIKNITDALKNSSMVDEVRIPNLELRRRFPTVQILYNFLVQDKNLYLPKWKDPKNRPKFITEEYLFKVLEGKYFSIKRDKIKKPVEVTKKCTKGELLKILQMLSEKPLGFEFDKEPNVGWLLKVIYSLNPDHEIFKPVEEIVQKTISKE